MKWDKESRKALAEEASRKPDRPIKPVKSRKRPKRPFIIEYKHKKESIFKWTKCWLVWAKYETEAQMEQALTQLIKSHGDSYHFRIKGKESNNAGDNT